jgi:hypothetical protein
MRDESILTFAAVFAITVAVAYAACTGLFYLFPGASAAFMNALFHGLDFSRLQAETTFDVMAFVYALVVLTTWAFLAGCLFGWVRRKVSTRGDAYVVSATMQIR